MLYFLEELAALEALLSGLNILVRCKVVHYQRNLGVVEHLIEARASPSLGWQPDR